MKKTWIALFAAAAMMCAAILPVAAEEETAAEEKGTLIYEETFAYADATDTDAVLATLGWTAQTKADGAYADPSAKLELSGARLAITGGSDSYYLVLTEEDMKPYDGQTITIQYDLEYTTASNTSRYFCMLANYTGQSYNSFHFRNGGNANNQCHVSGSWKTYDYYDSATDVYAAATDSGNGSSIAMKLLGVKYSSGTSAFANIPVTVRYVIDPENGSSVYMKLAEDPEGAFVLVSKHSDNGDAASLWGSWDANAICFKTGGAQNGYVDNIAVWTGSGNYPQPEPEPEETAAAETETAEPTEAEPTEDIPDESATPEEPKKVTEPHTVVNKIAVWATALFGGWIILKKGKEE